MSVACVKPTGRHTLRKEGRGFLEIFSSPVGELPVLHVAGSPEEIGRQYGALAGDRIGRNIRRSVGLFTATGLPEPVVCVILDKVWERLQPHVSERYLREMSGIAEGARQAGFDLTLADVQRITAVTKLDKSDWNVMSVVYAPTDLEFRVAYETRDLAGNWKNAPDSGYVHFNLNDLLAVRE